MKKILLIVIVIALLACDCRIWYNVYHQARTTSSSVSLSRNTVVIDAGHGGKDAGTIGFDGTQEKGINLSIALMLFDYLRVCGIDCVLMRDGDYQLYYENDNLNRSDLYNRLDYINAVDNSVLISIHQNHYIDEREWGTQVWYSANTPESKALADSILTTVKAFLQPDNTRENKASDDSYYLLYQATVPSVMVECGFMSNERENKLLQETAYQKNIAYSIMVGVCGEV